MTTIRSEPMRAGTLLLTAALASIVAPVRVPACDDYGDEDSTPAPMVVDAFGGLAALSSTPVRLMSLEVRWTQYGYNSSEHPHREASRVEISYHFSNPGPKRTERVGIRVSSAGFGALGARPAEANLLPPRVLVDGQPFVCKLERQEWRPWGAGYHWSTSAESWCTGALPIAAGTSLHVLEYESPTWDRGHEWNTIRQGFEAEATWSGPLEVLDVTLPLGQLPNIPFVVSPARFMEQEGVARWHVEHPDLALLPPVYVGWRPVGPAHSSFRVGNRGYTFAASSQLAPQKGHRYDAARALDGDGGTAWCEGVPGSGVGEWLEVRPNLDPALAAQCSLRGFEIIPGLASSPALWLANNRITRFRISSCSRPDVGVTLDLDRPASPRGNAWGLPDDPRLMKPGFARVELLEEDLYVAGEQKYALLHETECFRLTILGVKRGRVDDSCVAEFLPLLSCKETGFSYPIRPVQ